MCVRMCMRVHACVHACVCLCRFLFFLNSHSACPIAINSVPAPWLILGSKSHVTSSRTHCAVSHICFQEMSRHWRLMKLFPTTWIPAQVLFVRGTTTQCPLINSLYKKKPPKLKNCKRKQMSDLSAAVVSGPVSLWKEWCSWSVLSRTSFSHPALLFSVKQTMEECCSLIKCRQGRPEPLYYKTHSPPSSLSPSTVYNPKRHPSFYFLARTTLD